MADETAMTNIGMDIADLHVEEIFTDRRVGTIRRLTPVDASGGPDPDRAVSYHGQTQVLTPAGALPVNFEIEAGSLEEAVAGFGDAAKAALADTMERLEEMRREAASSIIVPDGSGGGLGGSGAPAGGGKIQMP